MRRHLTLVFVAALLVGACGSSGGSDPDQAASTTTAPPGSPAERRIANAGLLQDDDLPEFQRVTPSPSEAADLPTLGASYGECRGFIDASRTGAVEGRSSGYQRGVAIVDGSITVYDTADDAAAQIEAWRDPQIVGCLQRVYEQDVPNGTEISVSPLAVDAVGEDQFGFRITADTATPNGTQSVTVDIIGLRVGRAIFSLNILGTAAESAEVQSIALPLLVERLTAAQA